MNKVYFFVSILFLALASNLKAQTLDTDALAQFPAAVAREVFEVARYVKLDAAQQAALAKAFESENEAFVAEVKANEGILPVKSQRKLDRMHDANLAKILSQDQLAQYYRGVFDSAANAEGIEVANRLQKKYDLTDQNWKFIRIAFYKIGLESRVINKMMADKPAKAKKEIEKLKAEALATIEAKGGIRVDEKGTTVTVVRPFDPNTLHK